MSSFETIHIVTTLDHNYIQHCGVMLSSLFKNNPKYKFVIWLVIDFDENNELQKLKKFVNQHQLLKVIKIKGDQVSHFQTLHHITTATYYRLLIPNLVDPELSQILYLDVDIIIRYDIYSLWTTPLKSHTIAAVTEYGFNQNEELGLNENTKYFNAGVMLINLERWRNKDITNQLLSFLEKQHQNLKMLEQDALNIILSNDRQDISPRWNFTTNMYNINNECLDSATKDDIEESIESPYIVHYTGYSKPWHYLNTHPLKQEYYHYLSFTPWKSFKHPEDKYWHKIKQTCKKALNFIVGKNIFEIYK